MPNRHRVATTWNPDLEPELEEYIAAHPDNISAALRRALKAGIRVLHFDPISPLVSLDTIEAKQDLIIAKLDSLLISGTVVRNEIPETYSVDSGEVAVENLPDSTLAALKGLAR